MLAFAGNSILCRLALSNASIDPASFTSIRLASGALCLALIVSINSNKIRPKGNWLSAGALFTYAAAFSFAYLHLPAGIGALLLFGSVQVTMILYGLVRGERLAATQSIGLSIALLGLVFLLLPGLNNAPPPLPASLMAIAGIAWGLYSIFGSSSQNPTRDTASNFLKAVPFALLLPLIFWRHLEITPQGALLASLSGALASGIGYAIWYAILPSLKTTTASTIQLSVPAIAALSGALLLSESLDARTLISSATILGGIWLYLSQKAQSR